MLELLWSQLPVEQVTGKIQDWMRANPVSIRPNRPPPPRGPPSLHRGCHFQHHLKKTLF